MAVSKSVPFHLDLVSGPAEGAGVDDFELFYARRALWRLKKLIGREGLLDVLADDIAEGNAVMRGHAVQSHGEFCSGTTVLRVRGLAAAEFVGWMEANLTDETAMLAGHPEHFVMAGHTDESAHIVENIGPNVCSFQFGMGRGVEWAADAPELLPEDEFPFKKITNLVLDDQTVIGRVLSQFGDTKDGFTASLTVYLPVSCPDDVLEHHRRHFAVEFRNWITAAASLVTDG